MVGNFDFNENPVVSLDLDLDFGLGLRVCQKLKEEKDKQIQEVIEARTHQEQDTPV